MDKLKNGLAFLGAGIIIGGVAVWFLMFKLGVNPKSISVGPLEFEIPTSTLVSGGLESTDTPGIETKTLTVEPTHMPSPEVTNTPTFTIAPTNTLTPSPTFTPTIVVTDTPRNSELLVGESWVQDGVWLTLETVALGISNSWYHEFTFYIENNSGKEILFNPSDAVIEILDQNHISQVEMHSYRDNPDNRLENGEGNRFTVFFNTIYQFDPFSTDVDYFYIRVSNYSRIEDALWIIEVSH